jgi:TRAP-type mannitol/chloroaromatic compound transport system permease small subunit
LRRRPIKENTGLRLTFLLRLCGLIDALNERIGRLVYWLVLVAVLVSAGNAISRYSLSISSNAWLELQWYLFSAVFLLCAGYTLFQNQHIRIDIVSGHLSKRAQAWIDIIGGIFFLLPMAILIMWLAWPTFMDSYVRHEMSGDAGGLLRWPVKLLMPVGFALLSLQGLSETIKRLAYLAGRGPDPFDRPGQGHGESGAAQ